MRLPVLALAALLVVTPLAQAAAYPDPQKAPRYFDSPCIAKYDRRFVHDFVGVMDAELGEEIEGAACEVYANTSAHFVLAAVPDTGGESLESYALHLFETWGIGAKDTNDGILLLYVESYNYSASQSAAVRVEVGYGLEGVVNAHVANDAVRAMQQARQEELDAGSDEASARAFGLAVGAYYLLQTLDASYVDGHFPEPGRPLADDPPPWWFWVIVVLVALAIIRALAAGAHGQRGWGYRTGSSSTWIGPVVGTLARSRGGWGGGGLGGGGFGGGGFGGGRSGGGGGSGGF